jgi:hypothetical protein
MDCWVAASYINPTIQQSLVSRSHRPIQNRLLHMQPVFCLLENRAGVGFQCFLVNLFAAIRGQTVHHQRVLFRQLHQNGIDLVAGQKFDALLRLGFLAHRNPHVGVKQIRALRGGLDVARDGYVSARPFQQLLRRLEFFRGRDAQFKTKLSRRPNPRVRHVAGAVAYERNGFAFDRAASLLERENVRENLARMLIVGQRVDGRDAGKLPRTPPRHAARTCG